MKRLGISIYPEKSSKEEVLEYIDKAAYFGFSRMFSCLLSAVDDKEKIKKDFKDINSFAKSKGFEVIVDVSPSVFSKLGITYNDLRFFTEIQADGFRLDEGFTGNEEALMTFNEHDLKVEINASIDVHTIDIIMDYCPNRYNLYGCHNFYPHVYSGLDFDYFNRCTNRFKKYGLKTAAFVTSQNRNTFGPWPVTQGLVTLEMHRDLSLMTQVKHYLSMENIDDIIISNCYPSDKELEQFKDLDLRLVTFGVNLEDGVPELQCRVMFEELHMNRGDVNSNMIRSTQTRVKYKGNNFELFNAPEIIKRGDVVIESSKYGHYAGELQIAKRDMKNTGFSNVVGKVTEEELFILDYLKPWQKFKLKMNE
ncbi:DUF871 domain-containing protein [Candidatus Arthromitus sp. SFB-rat-Yit]|uniref:DUF871 domain-containing protein n=1 Tax=Candidatus Arthromitus sp. SFB-rat-Yit TaxID=1041504 RepID=UPI000227A6D4|nr:MupG family TIM beta-alpha barrel fold protein [Candidatus Arthromitus sp. SFB-rat-Yit]BAK81107.1 alpha3-beta1 integrin-binding protein [Candidatus Arthromitus sp. SFB-rat-Yit]